MTAPIPRLIAERYAILAELGRGGAGVVYRGRDTRLAREVAVKIVPAGDSSATRRQLAEVRAMAAVTGHPSVVSLYDAFLPDQTGSGDQPGGAVLVMELVDGPSLAEVLRDGPLPLGVVRGIGADVAAALAHLHNQGVLHRDIKPANVLIAGDGRAKLGDFGISRIDGNSPVTGTGLLMGSVGYFSPEQVRGEGAQPASDVYALGLVLLEALTGRREYSGPAAESALARLTREPAIPPGLPTGTRDLLGAMLALDPAARPSASEVVERMAALPLREGSPEADGSDVTIALPAAAAAMDATAPLAAMAPAAQLGPTVPTAPTALALSPVPAASAAPRRAGVWAAIAMAAAIVVIAGVVALAWRAGGPGSDGPAPTAPPTGAAEPIASDQGPGGTPDPSLEPAATGGTPEGSADAPTTGATTVPPTTRPSTSTRTSASPTASADPSVSESSAPRVPPGQTRTPPGQTRGTGG